MVDSGTCLGPHRGCNKIGPPVIMPMIAAVSHTAAVKSIHDRRADVPDRHRLGVNTDWV